MIILCMIYISQPHSVPAPQSKICHFPQNCLAEIKATALYVDPRKRSLNLNCWDEGGLKVANKDLRLQDNP
ncbi:hypothetical protein T4E_358 [Trichinella pseudospiralis]|uniref:Uncharacterized protein n=1 Tax=Trichinella pseudospiralis TaxID=6337 RepID=A0A0V0YKW6_TRIPS|nr:hypothetical protein T4E_358 [Trichinella pseudospiralis]